MSELSPKDGRFNTRKTSGVSHPLPKDHKVQPDPRLKKRTKGAMPAGKPTAPTATADLRHKRTKETAPVVGVGTATPKAKPAKKKATSK